jgi:hypothetical protein
MDAEGETLYSSNITHNLNKMAEAAGIYMHLWRPEEIGISKASQLIDPLFAGYKVLITEAERMKEFSPHNGWGTHYSFVPFVREYLEACAKYPDATVEVDR